MKNYKAGFSLVEVMIVVAVIGVIMAIAVPAYVRSRENARGSACRDRLARINSAKEMAGLDLKKSLGATITEAQLAPYLKDVTPKCPTNGASYVIGTLGTIPTCPNYSATSKYTKHELGT